MAQGSKRRRDTGLIRPYRAAPHDFREQYIRHGFSKELEDALRCNYRQIRRWIEECGGEELRRARAEHCGSANWKSGYARHGRRSKRYVLGRTLTAVTGREGEE